MLGDDKLACEQCGETSLVTFWRFEGLSSRSDSDRMDAADTRSRVTSRH
ncbi:hypothetical protein [Bradyrhizobium sp.]